MSDQHDQVRRRIIDGQASADEAERFIGDLERKLVSALEEAASATNRLAVLRNADAALMRTLPRIAGEDNRLTRLALAEEAINQHEATAGD
jgi:hypothetical protein